MMERRGRGRGRPRVRKAVQEMSTGGRRGRWRKTPRKTVNAIDDDTNPSFPENSRKRGRQITRAEDDELDSSSSSDTTDIDYSPLVPKITGRNRGRPRTTPQQAVNAADDDSNPSFPETIRRKRGRPRKTSQQAVNATDDDSNSSFPESSRKRGKRITRAEDDELNSSSSKELLTDGPSPYVQDSGVACNHPLPSNLVTSVTGKNVISSHHVQDSGVACDHPLPSDLVMTVTGENVNSRHLATPIDESNPIETEGDLYRPTKGKGVAAEPASETILLGNNVSGLLGENIAKNSVSSDSSKSKRMSSVLRSKRSKDAPIIPMDSRVNDDHLPQTQVNVVAKDARTTTCQSFNLTEAADKIRNTIHDDDDDDDGEDIQSAIDPSLVDVKGYRVKPEIAPLLNQIFKQHGDVVKDCKVKGLQGCFLEKVCSVYEKLQNSSFQEIKRGELSDMGETLDGLEEMGLNVKWLSDRLYDILDVKAFLKLYDEKRKELKKGNDHLITLEKAAAPIRENVSVLEKEILNMKGEEEKVQKARNLLNNSLVDGLI